MPSTKVVIIAAVATTAVLGLVIGGLIGHFVPKLVNSRAGNRDSESRKFLMKKISRSKMENMLRDMSRKPHLGGGVVNNELGEQMKSIWKSYGFVTKENKYDVLISYPGERNNRNQARILKSDDSVEFESQTEERVLEPSQVGVDRTPPYHAYSKPGVVSSSKVYYVNYCRDVDFDSFIHYSNVNLTGAIIMCRYGVIFRGNKVMMAQKHGAVGVIMFSDPADYVDLSSTNATYEGTFPHTLSLPPSGVQRGVVTNMIGDPLTRELPSLHYVHKKNLQQIRDMGRIPEITSHPISYEDATRFLIRLGGDEVPQEWRGAIRGVTYRYGGELPNGWKFQIVNRNTERITTITNHFGIIPGSEEPDRYILVGNHRDAWTVGAVDPLSGVVVQMEVGRVFSELMKTGWKPRRTIVFCSWDAGEFGMLGSIEWTEEMKKLLETRAVAYMNSDSAVMHPELFAATASPLMYNLIYESTKLVKFPNRTHTTLYDGWLADEGRKTDGSVRPKISDLGAGSAYASFFHGVGITSGDNYFLVNNKKTKINDWYALYHAGYETFNSIKTLIDPTFSYHKSLAQLAAEILRNLSDSTVVPFKASDYATRLQKAHTHFSNVYRDLLKSKKLDKSLNHLQWAIDGFTAAARKIDRRANEVDNTNWNEVRRINDQLSHLDRAFCNSRGIYGRSDMKHLIFAPSAKDFYRAEAFPGIVDSLYGIKNDDHEAWENVKEELSKVIYAVRSATILLSDPTTEFW